MMTIKKAKVKTNQSAVVIEDSDQVYVISYSRFSSEKQNEISIEAQQDAIHKYCEKHGYICNHYMFGFGEKAVETVKDYGITVDFNDINDNDSAYHLRDILLGKDVEKPKEV